MYLCVVPVLSQMLDILSGIMFVDGQNNITHTNCCHVTNSSAALSEIDICSKEKSGEIML